MSQVVPRSSSVEMGGSGVAPVSADLTPSSRPPERVALRHERRSETLCRLVNASLRKLTPLSACVRPEYIERTRRDLAVSVVVSLRLAVH